MPFMDTQKRKSLEAAGWRFGDAADFLGMSEEERQLLDARVEAAQAVRRQRQVAHLSQKDLASRIQTSQPRIAKIERAAQDVSLDQILRAFVAAGGRFVVKPMKRSRPSKGGRRKGKASLKPNVSEVQIELIGTDLK
jgi:hypothetical protein